MAEGFNEGGCYAVSMLLSQCTNVLTGSSSNFLMIYNSSYFGTTVLSSVVLVPSSIIIAFF